MTLREDNAAWDRLTEAFLHDPPDKALDVRGHEARARAYLEAAGLTVATVHGGADDVIAANAERVPMPSGRRRPQGWDGISVSPKTGTLELRHLLSARASTLEVPALEPARVETAVREVVAATGGARRFLRLWRLLPQALARLHPAYASLPADTRLPDHSIWDHADATAAIQAASEGASGPAFLSVSLGPVQTFIATARTLRDLWSGSYLLSHLIFAAMVPLLEELGPQSLVYPHLRGNPRVDRWLGEAAGLDLTVAAEKLLAPCLPNKFLALVPAGRAAELEEACAEAIRREWRRLASRVRTAFEERLGATAAGWDAGWDLQINGFFDVRTSSVPWRDERGAIDDRVLELLGSGGFGAAFPEAQAVRDLARAIPEEDRPGYNQDRAGHWQLLVAYSARLADAAKTVRHVPPNSDPGDARPKCTLLGTLEAMGPAPRDTHRDFWEHAPELLAHDGIRVRAGEKLCAVSLVKRFAPAIIRRELGAERSDVRFPDVSSVAASGWLAAPERSLLLNAVRERHHADWLYWPSREDDDAAEGEEPIPEDLWRALKDARVRSAPPSYYAILHADGDNLGSWLRGDRSPELRNLIHPYLVTYFEGLPARQTVARALDAKRPLGPALHAALSASLERFALELVPRYVESARGELVYAGGDDVVALLPVETALSCAHEIARAFASPMALGERASLSAGLAIVHRKDDLRDGLESAREAERAAKRSGRNAVGLAACRRSGEHALAVAPWSLVPALDQLRRAFAAGASDRWVYALRSDADTFDALPPQAAALEIARRLSRAEGGTWRALEEVVLEAWDGYAAERGRSNGGLADFAVLVQTASFLARGRNS